MSVPNPPQHDDNGWSWQSADHKRASFATCLGTLFLFIGGVATLVLGIILADHFGLGIVALSGFGIALAGLVAEFVRRREGAVEVFAPLAAAIGQPLPRVIVGFGVILVASAVFWLVQPLNGGDIGRAKNDVMMLTQALAAFKIQYDDYPDTLEALGQSPTGKPSFVEPECLKDPWGRPYDYDRHGPRNQGKHPDVWTVTPNGELIGNWMLKK